MIIEKREIIDTLLGKLNKENELSWGEISERTGLNFSPDHIRKMAYGIKLYDEMLLENDVKTSLDTQQIKEKIIELKKTRQQLSDERTLTNKKIRSLARLEDFVELIKDEIEFLSFEKPLVNKKNQIFITQNEAVLLLSDMHFGIDVDLPMNKYNPEIAYERITMLKERVIKYCSDNNVEALHVVELGDTISGHIHNNLRLENRLSVTKQIVKVAELISVFLYELSLSIPNVNFYMVEGNHDRVLPIKNDNLNEDSFNILVGELIKVRTNNIKNLKIYPSTGKTYTELDVVGFNCVGVHGDKDKPNNAVENVISLTGKIPDYVFMGHFHNANEYTKNQTEVIVNGSFSGVDEYAYNIRKNSKAVQKLMIFDINGRNCTYNITLN